MLALMAFILQSSIIFAVVASNIHWQWTPNGYLASMIGVGMAYGVTAMLNGLWRFTERRLRKG
jgi:hypothetical protein